MIQRIKFQSDISEMVLSNLLSFEVHTLDLNEYRIELFHISKIIMGCDSKSEIFKTNQLVLDSKMIGLISFIQKNEAKLIPPILEIAGNSNIIIRDGKHRIGLCWYLDIWSCLIFP